VECAKYILDIMLTCIFYILEEKKWNEEWMNVTAQLVLMYLVLRNIYAARSKFSKIIVKKRQRICKGQNIDILIFASYCSVTSS